MYTNGGYLMLDFKNTSIATDVKIDGIDFNTIYNTNKPIVVLNLPFTASANILVSFATSTYDATSNAIILYVLLGSSSVRIVIKKDNSVSIYQVEGQNSLNLESEVSTNAGKSDSNISK